MQCTSQRSLPIALSTAMLLGAGWIDASMAGLGEVAREVLFGGSGAIGEADVITVVALVSASHWISVSV